MAYTCFKAEQEIHATIAANYRRGVRRVTLRHFGGVLLLYLCLATLTGCAMAWYYPHTMTGTDRDTRMADYELTQQMVARK